MSRRLAFTLVATSAAVYLLGFLLDLPCRTSEWQLDAQLENLCYSDIPKLFVERGLADGVVPYLQASAQGAYLEYPVLLGGLAYLAATVTRSMTGAGPDSSTTVLFFDVNVALLFIPFVTTVLATALTARQRARDAFMVALAPTMVLAATLNWDLLPVSLVALSILAWSRERAALAGVLLGLAVSAKFYPLVLLGGFLLFAIRGRSWRPFMRLVGGSVVAWLVVNAPVALASFDGWVEFYTFSRARGADYGSPWFALAQPGIQLPQDRLNLVSTASFAVLCLGIAVLALRSRHEPRLAQLLFLTLAAFVATNKVYSPQYVLWLVPLAVLARPNWRDFMIWQAAEVWYFVAVWRFIDWQMTGSGISPTVYAISTLVHLAGTAYFAFMVVRDVLRPQHDPVHQLEVATPRWCPQLH